MIDKETVKHVAVLARLNLTDEELEKFAKDFEGILEAFSSLDEVNTEGLEPSFHPIEMKNIMREDEKEESLTQDEALSNAEQKEGKMFKGPRAV